MTIMVVELYEALVEAQVSEEKAKAAAKVIAEITLSKNDKESLATKGDLLQLEANLTKRLSIVETELALIKWLMGGIGFGVILLVVKSFF